MTFLKRLAILIMVVLSACQATKPKQPIKPADPIHDNPPITEEPKHLVPIFIPDDKPRAKPSSLSDFQMQLNPTQNPIGGGPGYKELITKDMATYVVKNKSTLKASLAKAKAGEIIFIDGESIIDLSGEKLTIPQGVTLASDRGSGDNPGALLFSNTMYPESSVDSYEDYLFVTAGPEVRFIGLRLRGPSAEIEEHASFVACGIKGMHGYLEVANCELSNWLKWAIDLAVANGDNIHHNYIHHTRRAGYGYGVWVRGSGSNVAPPPEKIPLIVANLFENCRHEIAGGGQETSSYIAKHNFIARHSMSNHLIDRHHQGYYTEVSHNVIAPANHLIFHGMSIAPLDALVFVGNWCDEKDLKRAFPNHDQPGWNIECRDNELGGKWRKHQPSVTVSADIIDGVMPFDATIEASGYDPDGYPVDAFLWDLEDGRNMRISASGSMLLHFENPGIYTVRVRARNSYGLYSEPASINIHVMEQPDIPLISAGLLAFWDFNEDMTWEEDITGRYSLQAVDPAPKIIEAFEGRGIQRNANPKELVQNPRVINPLARALQPGTMDFSFCIAFRVDQLPVSDSYLGLLGYGAGSEFESGYNLTLRSSEPSELSLFLSNGKGQRERVVIKVGIMKGRWYHLVVTVDRKLGLIAYVDGKEVTKKKLSIGMDDIYHDHHDFGLPSRFVQYPQASVDQVGCWDRVLKMDEASWLYNNGKGRKGSELWP